MIPLKKRLRVTVLFCFRSNYIEKSDLGWIFLQPFLRFCDKIVLFSLEIRLQFRI